MPHTVHRCRFTYENVIYSNFSDYFQCNKVKIIYVELTKQTCHRLAGISDHAFMKLLSQVNAASHNNNFPLDVTSNKGNQSAW